MTTTPEETIGERLRRLRLERGLSQRAIAVPGMGYAYVSRVERGDRTPSVKALRLLAQKLGVSVDYLETGREALGRDAREISLGEAELALRLDADSARARALFDEVLAEAVRLGDPRHAARARLGLGLTVAQHGDHVQAIALLEPALQEAWVHPASHPDAYATLGHSYASAGEPERAVELFRAALEQLRGEASGALLARFATYLSYGLADLGDLDGARDAVSQGLAYAAYTDDPYTRMRLYWSNARLATVDGDYETARASINRAIFLLEATEDGSHLGRAHLLAAEISLADGNLDEAGVHLEDAEVLVDAHSDVQDRAWFLIQRAFLNARQGRAPAAIDAATEAVDLLGGDEDPTLRGRAQWALGEALAAAGTKSAARAAFARASALLPPGSKYAAQFVEAWEKLFPADVEIR